jgi:hypothetical protein
VYVYLRSARNSLAVPIDVLQGPAAPDTPDRRRPTVVVMGIPAEYLFGLRAERWKSERKVSKGGNDK